MGNLTRETHRALRWTRRQDGVAVAVLLGAVGMADFLAGPEFMLSILYLVPIGFAAWRLRREFALSVAVASWALALYNSGLFALQFSQHPGEVLLDAVTTAAFFILTVLLLARLRENQAQLQAALDTDLVSGAASAHGFYRHAGREISRAARYRHPLALVYLDLDNFKVINDTYGHAEGDRLLRAVAETIRDNIRNIDTVARLGGDEFVILFPETGEDAARQAVTKVRERLLARMHMEHWPVTFSFGVVNCMTACPDLEDLLRQADALMYSVKKAGKDAVAFGHAERRDERQP